MKRWEKYAEMQLAKTKKKMYADWELFARIGLCKDTSIGCENCPFSKVNKEEHRIDCDFSISIEEHKEILNKEVTE